ncbi:MAG: hypothetical protein JEZ07_06455 [Phycisphaerae bacterium]|nr:hypothetical protein [Phycisphaerae bacterium]
MGSLQELAAGDKDFFDGELGVDASVTLINDGVETVETARIIVIKQYSENSIYGHGQNKNQVLICDLVSEHSRSIVQDDKIVFAGCTYNIDHIEMLSNPRITANSNQRENVGNHYMEMN